ncbi:hypothetical protein FHX57_006773 [Paraburkholderia tropica]|uniref:hypothetical protein n=1 Tax=Paraburkholderia tropica TaxID=92647 RepID=UPI00160FF6D7|nr:hypothetical protein [Paraburkholderia tropica]MBB3004391.1 hypothetical protein [Paraburkholderia tropica]
MSEFKPFEFIEFEWIDDDVIAGYRSGYAGDPEPGSDKSRSFFHGWRNGRVDGGHQPIDAAQQEFARSYVTRSRSY